MAAIAIVTLLACPAFLHSASADQHDASANPYKVGLAFRRFTPKEPYNWRGAKAHTLNTTVCYPADASTPEKPLEIPALNIFELGLATQDAKLAASPTKLPLIAISHGTGGSGLSMVWLCEALAAHGYIAAAPDHPGNNATEPYTLEGFSIWWERARDLSEVISGMLADPEFGGRIDAKRIGAAGFSLGGYTMIEIAGGITNVDQFMRYCDSSPADDLCKSPPEFPTLSQDLRKFRGEHPEMFQHAGDSFRDSRVRSVFAMAPAIGPAFPAGGLKKISIPVEIVAGQSDPIVPIASSARYFAANIPGAKLHIFPGAVGHYVFLNSCTDAGRKAVPGICVDRPGIDRDAIHRETIQLALRFFRSTLR